MQGLELIKNLAELDQELAEKVEETRRSAEDRVNRAEAESQRLLDEAEAQISRMTEEARTQMAEVNASLTKDAHQRAAAEQERLRRQAVPNLDRAVAFILSKVMP
jgi:vacuolar-type H+-ATPase subunit H